jgi:DNA replication protein DnaC
VEKAHVSALDDVDRLLRRLRLPYFRGASRDLLQTAKAQRWDPAEAVKVLLEEEVAGRDRATIAARTRAAGFPAGKSFESWDESMSSIPAPTQRALRSLEWIARKENLCVCGPSGTP